MVKIDSGMNRLGLPPRQVAAQAERLRALPGVGRLGWMTHFANADVRGGAAAALATFAVVTGHDAASSPVARRDEWRSLSNSAALIDCPAARADWVRPGIMLYGATPFADRDAPRSRLSPAMRLDGSVIAMRDLARRRYRRLRLDASTADRPIRIGIVDCGYADGYPRHAPTGTPVAVDGMRTRTVGRVSMDMMTVDLTPVPTWRVRLRGRTLWGDGIAVDDVAACRRNDRLRIALCRRTRARAGPISDRRFDDDGTHDGDVGRPFRRRNRRALNDGDAGIGQESATSAANAARSQPLARPVPGAATPGTRSRRQRVEAARQPIRIRWPHRAVLERLSDIAVVELPR